jgi:hypothetical protein
VSSTRDQGWPLKIRLPGASPSSFAGPRIPLGTVSPGGTKSRMQLWVSSPDECKYRRTPRLRVRERVRTGLARDKGRAAEAATPRRLPARARARSALLVARRCLRAGRLDICRGRSPQSALVRHKRTVRQIRRLSFIAVGWLMCTSRAIERRARLRPYSVRSATSGSTRVARRAGR